jgi:Family of unknown function (DUF6193)
MTLREVPSPFSEGPKDEIQRIYPELQAASLAVNLNDLIAKRLPGGAKWTKGGFKQSSPSGYYAHAREGDRSINCTVAALKRLFMAELWDKGVQLGSVDTPDLTTLASSAVKFLLDRAGLAEMSASFPSFTRSEGAEAHEAGAQAEVALAWAGIKIRVAVSCPKMRAVANILSENPILSKLMPVMSLCSLGFSSCTGYPYSTRALPRIVPIGQNLFQVSFQDRILGDVEQSRAVELLIGALPTNCQPAVQGTAETEEE